MENFEGGRRWSWSVECALTLVGSLASVAAIGGATFGVGAAVSLSLVPSAIALSCTS